jgi:NACalpha-BTF3-like transcription factor
MADNVADDDREEETVTKGQGGKQNKDLDTVTDFVESREMDASTAQRAMAAILDAPADAGEARDEARERELAAVAIEQADVLVVMREFELGKEEAERALRENSGGLVAALTALMSC